MSWPLATRIRRVDETLRWLAERRRASDDPGEVLRITDSIDRHLDERLSLMLRADGRNVGRSGPPRSPAASR